VLRRAEAKITDIDARIGALKTMRRSLGALIHACDGTAPVAKCGSEHAEARDLGRA